MRISKRSPTLCLQIVRDIPVAQSVPENGYFCKITILLVHCVHIVIVMSLVEYTLSLKHSVRASAFYHVHSLEPDNYLCLTQLDESGSRIGADAVNCTRCTCVMHIPFTILKCVS